MSVVITVNDSTLCVYIILNGVYIKNLCQWLVIYFYIRDVL